MTRDDDMDMASTGGANSRHGDEGGIHRHEYDFSSILFL